MVPQLEYVLRTVEERGVRFVQLWFTDVLGSLKGFAITPAELEGALVEGMIFDGSAIEGYSRVQESDMLAMPDPSTFEIVPWRGDDAPVARMFCDIRTLSGDPFEGDPRFVLRRNLERAREHGFTFFAGPEIEYFYFKSATEPIPLDNDGFFDLTHTDTANELRRRTILTLEAMGIPVEYSFHENGPSQHEIDLRYTDALSMADNVMTFRMVVKRIARSELGVHATFMPKPIEGAFGSGLHAHLSLFEGDVNAFHDPGDEAGLSKTGRHFIAGLLRHAREITAVTNQTVNSYKRLIVGYEAPTYISWARNNESALVRVPHPKADNESSTRVEFRSPDSACNPYLAFAVMLAAGMKGIEEGYALPPEATNNLFEMTASERIDAGIDLLPQSLAEAVDVMEGSSIVQDALGEHVFDYFIRNKRREWNSYKQQVTPWELDRYLEALLIMGIESEPLLVFPDPAPTLLAQTLDLGGFAWKAVSNAAIAAADEPADGWSGAIIVADEEPEVGVSLCRTLRKRDAVLEPLLLVVSGAQLGELGEREDLFDDFCLNPFHPQELEARLRHLMWRAGRGAAPELVEYGDLLLNLETYQAALSGKPLDLTYMEYELLKFFATHPAKVFTREQLLSRVWGYEYYGGARTVDVHVRRLRAKLGEEHANLIQTVRSVGYRFGQTRSL